MSGMSDRGADIPSALLDSPVSDTHLAEIVRKYLRNWEELAPRLELTPVQEEEIRNTYSRYGDQKRESLRLWRRIKGSAATYRALIAAAVAISNEQLADNIRDLLRASGQPTLPNTQPRPLLLPPVMPPQPVERQLSKLQCTQRGLRGLHSCINPLHLIIILCPPSQQRMTSWMCLSTSLISASRMSTHWVRCLVSLTSQSTTTMKGLLEWHTWTPYSLLGFWRKIMSGRKVWSIIHCVL